MATKRITRWRVVIVDDHPVVREGIRMCLKDSAEVELVGEAVNGKEGLRLIKTLKPDVVLLDLVMPGMNGLEALPRIRAASPKTKVIIFTYHNTAEFVQEAVEARVDGYLLKDSSPSDYSKAILRVMNGKFFLSAAASKNLKKKKKKKAPRFGLTRREFEYLKLAARGHRPKQVAQRMGCTPVTVRGYRKTVLKKLGLGDIAALARFAFENGL